jgi:hypothetical protein
LIFGLQGSSRNLDSIKRAKLGRALSSKLFVRLCGFICVAGVIMIIVSFNVNPGPPSNATLAQVIAYGQASHTSILLGSWLQALGSVFIVAFAYAIALLAITDSTSKWSGIMTFLGGILLLTVDLTEVSFYISALNSTVTTIQTNLNLIYAVQHFYFTVGAPAVFIPIGFAILKSHLLPRTMGYVALALGLVFFALGLAFVYTLVLPPAVTDFAAIQGVWWLATAIVWIVRADYLVNRRKGEINNGESYFC